MVFLKNKNKRI